MRRPGAMIFGSRNASLEAGEGKTGHIHTEADEGIFFFGSGSKLAVSTSFFLLTTARCIPPATQMAAAAPMADGAIHW